MNSDSKLIVHPLGSDVPLATRIKVAGRPAKIRSANIEVFKNKKKITDMIADVQKGRVSAVIPSDSIRTVGDYIGVFDIFLQDMGKQERPIPFKIIKSPLGMKRINADKLG